jgi:hypothetical protein
MAGQIPTHQTTPGLCRKTRSIVKAISEDKVGGFGRGSMKENHHADALHGRRLNYEYLTGSGNQRPV